MVQKNGSFHLEKGRGNTMEVFEGTLSDGRMTALHDLLNDERFQRLLPDAVSTSLLPSGFDETLLSVPRNGHWVSLRFMAGLGSDRNQPLLDRFTKWEASVARNSHRKISEETGRNNCLSQDTVQLKTRPD